MAINARRLLADLESLKDVFANDTADQKLRLLGGLAEARLATADEVVQLHEALCFLRAYPDDERVLTRVESMLAGFRDRADLKRFRRQLADSGIAGTTIQYEFYAQMARWLVRRWPDRLTVDWRAFSQNKRLEGILHLLALYCETPALDEFGYKASEWIDRLRRPDETDAAFLVRRLAALGLDPFVHEQYFESLALPLRLEPGPDTPARTSAKVPGAAITYQTRPLERRRPDLRKEIRRPPLAVHEVSVRQGRRYIDLACEAMVTRSRDLDVFAYGDPRDVRVIDCGDGLEFAIIGAIPERRLMFEAVYGFLAIKNGVPVGYVLNSALYRSVEVAYNIFDTYRGGEAARMYGRVLGILRHLFQADAFTIYPYQLGGEGNQEALQSGAWWFYQKLGFRAKDPGVLKLMRRELSRMRSQPRHRSSVATLAKLASENVYYHYGAERDDVIGMLPLGEMGLRISEYLAGRFGSDRAAAGKTCVAEAARRIGLRSQRGWSRGEKLAFERWSSLLLILPGIKKWRTEDKRDLIQVVRCKGGRRESDFVLAFDRHRKLQRALLRLVR